MNSLLLSLAILSLPQALCLLSPNCNISNDDDDNSTLKMMHADHPCSPFSSNQTLSPLERLSADELRHQFLSNLAGLPVAAGMPIIHKPLYIVQARFGTPNKPFLMAVDTSNDAAWVPCRGCIGCSSAANYDPTASSTFMPLRCSAPQCYQVDRPRCGGRDFCFFNMSYGGSTFAATLVRDTLTLATDRIPGYYFGCILRSVDAAGTVPPQGLLGLGRGQLSLLSQASLYQSTFSYCLPNFGSLSFSGSLRLGARNQPMYMKCTPLLRNPRRSSLYYVNLVAIMVGSRLLRIPSSAFDFDANTGAGTIIDSGTTFTRLVRPAYAAVRDEVRRRMGGARVMSVGGFDTCYNEAMAVKSITLIFDGMSMYLPPENFLIRGGSDGPWCLAMAASPGNVNSVVNIIAGFQQQNYRILMDQPNSRLCVAPEICT